MSGSHLPPLFASVPHSGRKIPAEAFWLKKIPPSVLIEDTDAFVDELYLPALREFRIPALVFEYNRYALDLNRFASDISPRTVAFSAQESLSVQEKGAKGRTALFAKAKEQLIFTGPLPNPKRKNRKSPSDVHWHKTTKGDILIKKPLPEALHQELIEKYFAPFHRRIQQQFERLGKEARGTVYMLDLHSMPSKGRAFHTDHGQSRAQIVIGDCEGRSASSAFRDLVLKAFQLAGFETALNRPYKGGALTQSYGQPAKGRQALQIELNRKLYMDESAKTKKPCFSEIQARLRQAVGFIVKKLDSL